MTTRVLIVDDERRLARSMGQALQLGFSGCDVDTAYSGEEALSLLASRNYDLIIADVHMPGVSGVELVRGIRYLDGKVPIVLMTGYGTTSLRSEAVALGVDHYIDKPFDMNDLISMIRELLLICEESDG